MSDQRNTAARAWKRTTQALGKLWAGVLSLPERQARRDQIFPHFPPF